MMAIDTFPRATLDPSRTTGLILCGMGGPDRPEAVQPFLRNLFADPLIFPVPRLFAGIAGRLIAWKRAPEVRKRYAMISADSATPQLPMTRNQAAYLAAEDQRDRPGHAARRGHALLEPFPQRSGGRIDGRRRRSVPDRPHLPPVFRGDQREHDQLRHRCAEEGRSRRARSRGGRLAPGARVSSNPWPDRSSISWPSGPRGKSSRENAPSSTWPTRLPESFIRKGDPYLERTRATVTAVHASGGKRPERRGARRLA